MGHTLLLSWSNLFRAKQGNFVCFVVNPLRSLIVCVFPITSIVVPDDGYLSKVHELCRQHKVLLICDEIQTVSVAFSFPDDVERR